MKMVEEIRTLPEAKELFAKGGDVFLARAPGRLDVMGGIADYSGSLVLEMPIREATVTALQRIPERKLTIISLSDEKLQFEMPLSDFEINGKPINYAVGQEYFSDKNHWASYVAGVFLVLMRERGMIFNEGARILITSDVPQGKGVSSSAAIEASVMEAVKAAFNIEINPRNTALLSQKVENLVAGAPCGVMDQMTVVCGQSDRLLALLCRPAEITDHISIPDEISFWGIDSGIRHAVSGPDYGSVRVGAFMGLQIIADEMQREENYLTQFSPSEYEQFFANHIPDKITGIEFISRYKRTRDTVTTVSPDKEYAVRIPTEHAIYEHHRVQVFSALLQNKITEESMKLLGELMHQSHISYSACGLGSDGTDLLVQLIRNEGSSSGLYGAKITGGGNGGTIAVLGRKDASDAISKITRLYEARTGYKPYIFSGSSNGSSLSEHRRFTL